MFMETLPYKMNEGDNIATISEIAKRAGVGATTVSRYLNNHPYISKEKCKRIKKAIEDLNYVPSSIASQMRSKKSMVIGVLVSRVTNPFFSVLFDKMERLLHKFGFEVMITQTYDDPSLESVFLKQLKSGRVDAVILASIEDENEVIKTYREFPQKVILVNEKIKGLEQNSITLDHYNATLNGLEYLWNIGRNRIAYVTGGKFKCQKHGSNRNQAYLDFLNTHQLKFKNEYLFSEKHTLVDGQQIAKKIMQLSELPDAIFANSDEVAVGIIDELIKNDVSVPEKIAVMGYDDQPLSKYVKVPLTTIHQPIDALAAAAVSKLLNNLDIENEIEEKDLSLKLIVRESA